MTNLAITQVPEELVDRLRQLARNAGVDMETEALQCLERGLREIEQTEVELQELRQLRSQSGGIGLTDDEIRQARDEGRL